MLEEKREELGYNDVGEGPALIFVLLSFLSTLISAAAPLLWGWGSMLSAGGGALECRLHQQLAV